MSECPSASYDRMRVPAPSLAAGKSDPLFVQGDRRRELAASATLKVLWCCAWSQTIGNDDDDDGYTP